MARGPNCTTSTQDRTRRGEGVTASLRCPGVLGRTLSTAPSASSGSLEDDRHVCGPSRKGSKSSSGSLEKSVASGLGVDRVVALRAPRPRGASSGELEVLARKASGAGGGSGGLRVVRRQASDSEALREARARPRSNSSTPTARMGPQPSLITSDSHPTRVTWLHREEASLLSRVAISEAPGKRIALARDGCQYERSLLKDVKRLREAHGITMTVCLLSQSELRHLGVSLADYKKICEDRQIRFAHHPVVEMAPFADQAETLALCREMVEHLQEDPAHRVLVHCRGGLGRAGTLGACLTLFCQEVKSHMAAIAHVRKHRSPRAVESRKQEDCIRHFQVFLEKTRQEQEEMQKPMEENEGDELATQDGSNQIHRTPLGLTSSAEHAPPPGRSHRPSENSAWTQVSRTQAV